VECEVGFEGGAMGFVVGLGCLEADRAKLRLVGLY
jgi:hypothetical protein